MSSHRRCCNQPCGGITCLQWCDCLPNRATVHNLLIEIDGEYRCGGKLLQDYKKRIQLQNVSLVKTEICTMVPEAGANGTWSYQGRVRDYVDAPDAWDWPANCPAITCRAQCDQTYLCKTDETTATGSSPGILISCDNACQPVSITDAFSKLEWQIGGNNFTVAHTGHRPFPDLENYLACRSLPPSDCDSSQSSTQTGVTLGFNGVIWGQRGCLTTASFASFNPCPSLVSNSDGLLSCNLPSYCTKPDLWCNCYVCKSGTMENAYGGYQLYQAKFITCGEYRCCGGHYCRTGNPPTETYCCGHPSCLTCQTYTDSAFGFANYTIEAKVTLVFSVP